MLGAGIWYPEFRPPPPPVKIAPLTLTYGQDPPRVGVQASNNAEVEASWPAAWNPAQNAAPNASWNGQIVYGDQPPKNGPYTGSDDVVTGAELQSWPPAWWPAQAGPPCAHWNTVAPPVLPTIFPYSSLISWPALWWSAQAGTPGASWNGEIVYGDQPPPSGFLGVPDLETVGSWPASWWPAFAAPPVGAIAPGVNPSIYIPPTGLSPLILRACYEEPTTTIWLASGLPTTPSDNPPISAFLSPVELAETLISWLPAPWGAQNAAPTASWNITLPSSFLPSAKPSPIVLASWPSIWWPAEAGPLGAPVLPAPPVFFEPPFTRLSLETLISGIPIPGVPQRLVSVAPLTLVAPTRFDIVRFSNVLAQWPATWNPAQGAAPVAPLTLIYGQQPPVLGVRVPLAALLPGWPQWSAQYPSPVAAIGAVFAATIMNGTLVCFPVYSATLDALAVFTAMLDADPESLP